jgi:hypothetical protein
MATFLDVTALESFSVVFVFLFVWLVIYALLLYTKILGQNQVINILVGLLIAFFVIISELATLVVRQIAPVFAVVLVFVAVISIAARSMGASSLALTSPAMKYAVLVILIVALVVSSLAIVRSNIDVPETGEDYSKTSTIIFHPNFLGLILIFLVAVFTIGLLAARQT